MIKLPDEITIGEKYGPVMKITTEEEAKEYLAALVEHCMRKTGNSPSKALAQELSNIGYYSGYCDSKTAKRINKLFNTTHPIFGDVRPSVEETFEAGVKIGGIVNELMAVLKTLPSQHVPIGVMYGKNFYYRCNEDIINVILENFKLERKYPMIKGTFESKKVTIDGVELNPEESQKLINHSPDGFNWGYAGSGPAQLALALLMFFTTKHNALKYHQAIKTDIIQNLPQEDFELPVLEIKNWIALNIPRD